MHVRSIVVLCTVRITRSTLAYFIVNLQELCLMGDFILGTFLIKICFYAGHAILTNFEVSL